MATSDSDDFESADEEFVANDGASRNTNVNQWKNSCSAIDSESDDDNECMPTVNSLSGNRSVQTSGVERRHRTPVDNPKITQRDESPKSEKATKDEAKAKAYDAAPSQDNVQKIEGTHECLSLVKACTAKSKELSLDAELKEAEADATKSKEKCKEVSDEKSSTDAGLGRRERPSRQRKPKETKSLGAKKLGIRVIAEPALGTNTPDDIRKKALAEGKDPPIIEGCWEFNEEETAKILKGMKDCGLNPSDKIPVKMPEELKSDKKFKEIFKPDGWENLDDSEILAELDDNKVRPVLDKIVEATSSKDQTNAGWGEWGSWGVSTFLNTASAGVATLSSHVSHGLTLLEEAVGAPNPEELAKEEQANDPDTTAEDPPNQEMPSFGFNDFMSGVSSITKLVESTGTKVITGGLGTLETIGKKTMEVLQEGDPGLKKKRAFFRNESDKPILSKILREAKEKAEVEEATLEEKEMTRKVHFESLFDDYQGLVHLEALEMLSKRSSIKIQERLATLANDEFLSLQDTLEEVKELCELGDEDEEEENETNLQERLKSASDDLGVAITYEKLYDIWKDTKKYLEAVSSPESTATEKQVFQRAISTLAHFTAFSVERFHKTAELLLIKERRSTVNEADALVQLTRILSGQIGIAANSFSNWLNERSKTLNNPDNKVDITTIFLEAANASSYIQDAFRLLIPILQVGAI